LQVERPNGLESQWTAVLLGASIQPLMEASEAAVPPPPTPQALADSATRLRHAEWCSIAVAIALLIAIGGAVSRLVFLWTAARPLFGRRGGLSDAHYANEIKNGAMPRSKTIELFDVTAQARFVRDQVGWLKLGMILWIVEIVILAVIEAKFPGSVVVHMPYGG
jgi:hypothetical protein